jgi:hypothetical protein
VHVRPVRGFVGSVIENRQQSQSRHSLRAISALCRAWCSCDFRKECEWFSLPVAVGEVACLRRGLPLLCVCAIQRKSAKNLAPASKRAAYTIWLAASLRAGPKKKVPLLDTLGNWGDLHAHERIYLRERPKKQRVFSRLLWFTQRFSPLSAPCAFLRALWRPAAFPLSRRFSPSQRTLLLPLPQRTSSLRRPLQIRLALLFVFLLNLHHGSDTATASHDPRTHRV